MSKFLQTAGTQILDSTGNTLRLKGVGFGNEVWYNDNIPENHHSEVDFARVRDMGMNAIRFYLNYRTFEKEAPETEDKTEGWAWLDENVRWAKKYGLYLVLNLHVSHGGFQGLGDGDELWRSNRCQERLINFWKKVAKRYQSEPSIAGYSLLNKPVPGNMDQWQHLAEKLVEGIREIDKNHIIFLEQAYYLKDADKESADLNFPLLEGENIVYEFQMYQPYSYTHQLLDWAGLGDQGSYPDPNQSHHLNETPGYDQTNEPGFYRNKRYLEASMKRYLDWSQQKQVPLFMCEFGTSAPTFENGKGGQVWVEDVLSIANEANLSYSYHAYHEDAYGIYFGNDHLPDPTKVNVVLRDLLKAQSD